MSLPPGRAASAMRRIWVQERGEIAQVADGVTLVAEGVGNLNAALGGGTVRGLLELLEHTVLPYLDWEETIVAPVIDRLYGTPRASRRLARQLQRVRTMTALVQADWQGLRRTPTHRQAVKLRAHLRGLGVVLRSHLEQVDRVLAPVLAPAGA